MKNNLLVSFYYLVITLSISIVVGSVIGVLIAYIDPTWGIVIGCAMFGYFFTQFILVRKRKWLP